MPGHFEGEVFEVEFGSLSAGYRHLSVLMKMHVSQNMTIRA
jgi:hypothetical protein